MDNNYVFLGFHILNFESLGNLQKNLFRTGPTAWFHKTYVSLSTLKKKKITSSLALIQQYSLKTLSTLFLVRL